MDLIRGVLLRLLLLASSFGPGAVSLRASIRKPGRCWRMTFTKTWKEPR
ncbi:EGFLAM isoform 3, partial [Pongo abelii]